MERIRVIYSKSKNAIFYDTKDLVCIFEESLKRANIKFNYINDQPDFTFAYPLPIGIESIYEILDIVIEEEVQSSYFIKQLNNNLPKGITCLNAEYIDLNSKSIEMSIFASVYVIKFLYDDKDFENKTNTQIQQIKDYNIKKFKEYLDEEQILVLKKQDDRLERIDIKNNIKDYNILLDGGIEITVDTGARSNMQINDLMVGFKEYVGKTIPYTIRRTKILYK